MSQCQPRPEYDVWLHWMVADQCNLSCAYCSSPRRGEKSRAIDTTALSTTLRSTGKTFHISFVGGGEPFLVPNFIDACAELARDHYVSVVTNLTSARVAEFARRVAPERVVSILASLHAKELERLSFEDRFIENFLMCRDRGFSIAACEVAYPALQEEIPRIRDLFGARGIEVQFNHFTGNHAGKRYPESYTDAELTAFGLDRGRIDRSRQQGTACNAGYNVALVRADGAIQSCYHVKDRLGNVYREIKLRSSLIRCPFRYCSCPLNLFDPVLYERALREDPPVRSLPLIRLEEKAKAAVRGVRAVLRRLEAPRSGRTR